VPEWTWIIRGVVAALVLATVIWVLAVAIARARIRCAEYDEHIFHD
jgi:hypothetical protein